MNRKKREKMRRVISLLLLIVMAIGGLAPIIVRADEVEGGAIPNEGAAEAANFMAGKMISYFGGKQVEDISTISTEELRVYAIFMSNFFKPGSTKVGDIIKEDSQMIKDVESALFSGEMSGGDKTQYKELNKLVYKALVDGIKDGDKSKLKDNKGADLTGLRLKEMMVEAVGAKSGGLTIKHGGGVHLDLTEDAVRGAFKILLGYNTEFMIDKSGIESYTKMYVDGYGNIWGSVGEVVAEELTLVMPAALNPATFSGGKYKKADRLPLNNAFGMGAMVTPKEMSEKFKTGATAYYNLREDIKTASGSKGSTQIWGLTTPFETTGDTGTLATTTKNSAKSIVEYYNKAFNEIDASKTKIMINTGMTDSVLKRFEASMKNTEIPNNDKGPLSYYLASSIAVPVNKVMDKMFYSTSFSPSALTEVEGELKNLGITGQSMFTQQGESAIYGASATNNKFTTQLDEFISSLDEAEKKAFTGSNAKDADKYKSMGKKYEKVFGTKQPVTQLSATKTGKGLVDALTEKGSVPGGVAAVLFLAGHSDGVKYNLEHGVRVVNTPITISGGQLGVVEKPREGVVTKFPKGSFLTFIKTGWVYGMTPKDAHLWLALYGGKDVDYTGASTDKKLGSGLIGGSIESELETPKGSFKDTANTNVFLQTHVFKVFGPHDATIAGGMNVGTKIKVNGTDTVTDTMVANSSAYWPGIFLAYMDEVVDLKAVSEGRDAAVFNSTYLPPLPKVVSGRFEGAGSSSLSEESPGDFDADNLEKMQKDLIEKIYGIVSDKPNAYRDRWLKSTIDGFLITLHKTLTGSWLGDMQTVSAGVGSTYTPVAGYIHTPTLEDLPFTDWVMANYRNIYVLVMLVVTALIIMMVLTRLRTVYQGVAIFCLMAVTLVLPQILITNTVNISNKVSDNIYSERFDFWAIVQHQKSKDSLAGYGSGTSTEQLIANTMQRAEELYSDDAGVRVKWMSPKKVDVFDSLYSSIDMSDSFVTNMQVFKWLFNSFIYDSEFVKDDPLATYLYRPYNSLAVEAQNYYEVGDTKVREQMNGLENVTIEGVEPGRDGKTVTTPTQSYSEWVRLYNKSKKEQDKRKEELFRAGLFNLDVFGKENYTTIYYGDAKINDIKSVSKYKESDDVVDSIALWGTGNPSVNEVIFKEPERILVGTTVESGISSNLTSEMNVDSLSYDEANLSLYLRDTESPYYYFYATLKHRYGGEGLGTNQFKKALLNKDVFRVYGQSLATEEDETGRRGLTSTRKPINGAMRDFLDLEGLFTYKIPYLTASNDYVYEWVKLNGASVSAFDFKGKEAGGLSGDEQEQYELQKMKKEDMGRVWNMYSPWVDQLNALKTTKTKARVAGKTIKIDNALNPGAYLEKGRPMIYSEADMIAKGYTEGDLTDIEIRIQEVLRATYKDLMYLVNYYDMDDDVLINAAAMYATFNFNRVFSQNNVVGASTMIYPQNFEMKNFNYDAFMQLMMLNATGERIDDSQDLYTRIIGKTSSFTGVFLLISDIIGVIVIPTMKIVILLALLFLGLVMSVVIAINPPEKIFEAVMNSLLIPSVKFMLANMVFAYIISIFVGEGLTAYVGNKGVAVSVNDPVVTLVIVGAIGIVYSMFLWQIFKELVRNTKEYSAAAILAGAGIVSGAVMGVSHKVSNVTGRAMMGGTTAGDVRGAGRGSSGVGYDRQENPYRKPPMTKGKSGGVVAGVGDVASNITKKTAGVGKKAVGLGVGVAGYGAYKTAKLGKKGLVYTGKKGVGAVGKSVKYGGSRAIGGLQKGAYKVKNKLGFGKAEENFTRLEDLETQFSQSHLDAGEKAENIRDKQVEDIAEDVKNNEEKIVVKDKDGNIEVVKKEDVTEQELKVQGKEPLVDRELEETGARMLKFKSLERKRVMDIAKGTSRRGDIGEDGVVEPE